MITNLKFNFNQLWKYIAGGATILAYQAFYERIQSQNAVTDQKNDINTIKNNIAEVKEMVTKNVQDESIKTTLFNKIEPLSDTIKQMELLQKSTETKLKEQIEALTSCSSEENPSVASAIEQTMKTYNQNMGEHISYCIKRTSELEKFFEDNGINKKLFEDNFISNLIKDFNVYLSTLSTEQICILMDFLLITIVLSCLITILFAFYGNFLIDKLSLEEKYPKLSGIIKLRRKFQHYYIISNSLIIIFALIFMGYINLLTLLNPS